MGTYSHISCMVNMVIGWDHWTIINHVCYIQSLAMLKVPIRQPTLVGSSHWPHPQACAGMVLVGNELLLDRVRMMTCLMVVVGFLTDDQDQLRGKPSSLYYCRPRCRLVHGYEHSFHHVARATCYGICLSSMCPMKA